MEALPRCTASIADHANAAAAVATKVLIMAKRRIAVGLQVGAGIEAEPADPQEGCADHGERHGVGAMISLP